MFNVLCMLVYNFKNPNSHNNTKPPPPINRIVYIHYTTLLLLETINYKFKYFRLCGVAADGPYQTRNFRASLVKHVGITFDDVLSLPVTWDPAHLLNLAVTDIKDAASPAGIFFRLFIKRSNIFNHLLSHGKGFAFLKMVDEKARRPVSYAAQRFASSSYDQWTKIFKSYASYIEAFEKLHPNRNDDEDLQYMIKGSDYIHDLLTLMDIMKPLVSVMLKMQSLDCPIWKLKKIWPSLLQKLNKAGRTFSNI